MIKSKCCNAPCAIQGNTTKYYTCMKCNQPCDCVTPETRKEDCVTKQEESRTQTPALNLEKLVELYYKVEELLKTCDYLYFRNPSLPIIKLNMLREKDKLVKAFKAVTNKNKG